MTDQTIEKTTQITQIKQFIAESIAEEALQKTVDLLKNSNPKWDWVGIYLLKGSKLVLGPYAGEVTEHTTINIGDGVCGTAIAQDKNLIIEDVNQLDNYIACSIETKSEIVVLIKDSYGEKILGQFDLDSDTVRAFGDQDEEFLQELAPIVAPALEKVLNSKN